MGAPRPRRQSPHQRDAGVPERGLGGRDAVAVRLVIRAAVHTAILLQEPAPRMPLERIGPPDVADDRSRIPVA